MRSGGTSVLKMFGAVVVLVLSSAVAPAVGADEVETPGFSIHDGRLIDAYGNDFVMRGINHPYSWFPGELAALAEIKATGANTVRVVLSTGDRYARSTPDQVADIVGRCRAARLVCVLEVHDTTGYGEAEGAIHLDRAVDYWIEQTATLVGHEAYVIVNIGNEPFGNADVAQWSTATTDAIHRLRDNGFRHTLMVDAPNWGQDWSSTMRDNAGDVFASDPLANVLFDVHMYGVFNNSAKVRSYIESFVRAELPLVIGEFGATHTDGDPDEAAIMHWAHMYGIGYLGWSWSGNTDPVRNLNVVQAFNPRAFTAWGHYLVGSVRGIARTASEASIFGEPVAAPRQLLAEPPTTAVVAAPAPRQTLARGRFEAEEGVWNGLSVSLHVAGYSGGGYLTGFDARGDSVTIMVQAETAGLHDLVFAYRAPFGDKLQQLVVNGQRVGPITFGASASFTTAVIRDVLLVQGSNHVGVVYDWGWFDLDYVEVWV